MGQLPGLNTTYQWPIELVVKSSIELFRIIGLVMILIEQTAIILCHV